MAGSNGLWFFNWSTLGCLVEACLGWFLVTLHFGGRLNNRVVVLEGFLGWGFLVNLVYGHFGLLE